MSIPNDGFEQYETRFQQLVGDIKPGQFGRFKGRLVKRLNREEFREQLSEYERCGSRLEAAMQSGNTLSESLMSQIRSLEVTIVLETSKYLP
ncbi:MAG: hypothetical protein CMH52_11700 [Myxococcales bacterium]|nr:hypothetical protein [Myxococcales bacterium]|tara:strand:+ start:2013 stop:2288 length:276 start_codon:yes stop_codon:yes gene_type:complete